MTLPVPNLDNQSWDEIVERARLRIPRIAKDWTDWNAHDPGITFIELFAWLAEMQRFRLSQVPLRTHEQFFKLVNLGNGEAYPAQGWLEFESLVPRPSSAAQAGWLLVPSGTPVRIPMLPDPDPFAFQVSRDGFVTSHRIRRLLSITKTRRIDQRDANQAEDVSFFPFGADPREDAALEIELEALTRAPVIDLWIDLFEDDLGEVGRHGDELGQPAPSVRLRWEFYDRSGWSELEVESDDTLSFHRTGTVRLRTPPDAPTGRPFAFRCVLTSSHFEIPPRLRALRLNVIEVAQTERVLTEDLGSGSGRPDQEMSLKQDSILGPAVTVRGIQVGDVRDWEALEQSLSAPNPRAEIRALQHQLPGRCIHDISPSGVCPFSEREERDRRRYETVSHLRRAPNLEEIVAELPEYFGGRTVTIQVFENNEGEPEQWVSWKEVDDFFQSTHTDRHYTLDRELGVVRFGNGLNGRAPSEGAPVRAKDYRHTRGKRGNLTKGLGWAAEVAGTTLNASNPAPVTGGRDAEELEDSRARAEAALHTRQRGVTGNDLEELALSSPGMRVARAKALPNHDPRFGPSVVVPGSSTVVVVPERRPGDSRPPVPGDGFLRAVRGHLDRHRLVTTTIHVIPPQFVQFAVVAKVFLKRRAAPDRVQLRVQRDLERYFDPFHGGPESDGWPLGRAVHPSEIYEHLDRVQGIEYSVGVTLVVVGGTVPLLADSKLDLPPQGLPAFAWAESEIRFFRFGEGDS